MLFTARDGATLSGHIWATRSGPAHRPGIVITNGSVQADEQLYWFAAQALAKDGYVVMTFDPQGQGQSDTPGEIPDQNEGVPAQSDGRPFFDGTEDALNFFFSTPGHPYEPVPSCSSGTSHAPKQNRRVTEGLDTAYNPYSSMLDPSRVGIAGHSYGAAGVSYIGQWDPRVKAIVAWDNLESPDPNQSLFSTPGPEEQPCPGDPGARNPAPVSKPALGMSADYFIPPEPNTSQPDPLAKSTESRVYTQKGVDTGEIIIRGGTHYDFDWIPNSGFPATLRGADEITWYTTAWFDKYVKGDSTADSRLLTNRWRDDAQESAVDPNHDGNMFSFYYLSRLDFRLHNGARFDCENMRNGCAGLTADDCYPGAYSYVAIDTSPDGSPASAPQPAHCDSGVNTSTFTCAKPSGGLSGRTLGPVTLGMTRSQARTRFARVNAKRRRYVDYYCSGSQGLRVGYPSGALLHPVSRAERRHVSGRAVLVLAASTHYSLHGVRHGEKISTVAHHVHLSRRFTVGLNRWYLIEGRYSRGVLKVRGGRVQEVGIADLKLTNGRRRARRFLESFS